MSATARLVRLLLLLLALPVAGTLGFMTVEGWSFVDSLYMAVITLTTVGFQEVQPLSTAGRMLVIVYLVGGLGIFLYGITQLGELLIRGELRQSLGRRLMHSMIRSFNDHSVICGCGRTGARLCELLAERGEKFVVVDRDSQAVEVARKRGWPFLVGDATEDATLRALHVPRAKGLAAVLTSDADNLFVVLSARLLNPDLNILARAKEDESIDKLERAGADQIVSLHQIGATKMVHLLTNPRLVDFIEILDTADQKLDMMQMAVPAGSPRCHLTLEDADFRARGVSIVGIRRKDGEFLFLPPGATSVLPDDTLMALGPTDALQRFLADS